MLKFNSIRTTLIFSISLFIVLLLVVTAAGTYAYFRHTTKKQIFNEQFSVVTDIAKGLDDKIMSSHTDRSGGGNPARYQKTDRARCGD